MPACFGVSAFSDESWGGDHKYAPQCDPQHEVSAFSDESWGGDLLLVGAGLMLIAVSAFSDESWGGDPVTGRPADRRSGCFSIL